MDGEIMVTFFDLAVEDMPRYWLAEIDHRKRIGVDVQKGWCAQFNSEMILFDTVESCMLLLPFLELDWSVISNALSKLSSRNPELSDLIQRFPKELLLRYALKNSVSGYWPQKALAWLATDEWMRMNLKTALFDFSQKKNMPQQLRHIAKKFLR